MTLAPRGGYALARERRTTASTAMAMPAAAMSAPRTSPNTSTGGVAWSMTRLIPQKTNTQPQTIETMSARLVMPNRGTLTPGWV